MQRTGFSLIELLVVAAVFSLTALLATTVFTSVQSTQRGIQAQQRITSDGRYLLETIARSIRTSAMNYGVYANGVTSASLPETKLSVISSDGIITCYEYVSGQKKVTLKESTTIDCTTGTPQDFTPSDVEIENLSFYLRPQSDPFRSVPRSAVDCKVATATSGPPNNTVTDGFDSQRGVCVCSAADKCWDGQRCMSTANEGAGCNISGSEANCICQNPNIQPQVTIYLKSKSTNVAAGEQAEVALQTTVVSRLYRR